MSTTAIAWDVLKVAGTKVLPCLLINKAFFFIGYKITGNVCIVDPAWAIGHLVAGAVYAHHFSAYKIPAGQVALALLGIWALRLGGFLFYHRVYKGYFF